MILWRNAAGNPFQIAPPPFPTPLSLGILFTLTPPCPLSAPQVLAEGRNAALPPCRDRASPCPPSAPQVLAEEEGKLGIPVTFAIDSDNPLMCAQVGG